MTSVNKALSFAVARDCRRRNILLVKQARHLSYVADPPRGFAPYLEKVMKRQWGSRRDTTRHEVRVDTWLCEQLADLARSIICFANSQRNNLEGLTFSIKYLN